MWYIVKVDVDNNVRRATAVRADSNSEAIDVAFPSMNVNTEEVMVAYTKRYDSEPSQNEINVAANVVGCPNGFDTVRWD